MLRYSGVLFFLLILSEISFTFCSNPTSANGKIERNDLIISDSDISDLKNEDLIPSVLTTTLLRYDLENPDEKFILPKYLEEISGITYYENDEILCIQDEKANIYIYNLLDKKVDKKYDFGKDGDYEDITLMGDRVFIIRSDGKIFIVEDFENESRQTKEYNTPLSSKNDSEGICYDKYSNSILVACKKSPNINNDISYKGSRAIYSYDIITNELSTAPKFLINMDKEDSFNDESIFNEYTALIQNSKDFGVEPSAIAINPIDSSIYILSSKPHALVILNRSGKILSYNSLKKQIFNQPEGICFSPSGDMYISNEGKNGTGNILKFRIQKQQ